MSTPHSRRTFLGGTLALVAAVPLGSLAGMASMATTTTTAFADAGPWPAFLGNNRHSGLASVAGPRVLTMAWYVNAGDDVESSAVIANDGSVYVAANNGRVLGRLADGGEKWTFESGARVYASPILGLDGEILIGDTGGRFRSLRAADGTIAWTVRDLGSVRGTATVAPDGTIFVGTEGGQLLALDSRNQGKEQFRVEARAGVVTAPAIAPNGDVYWAALDNELRRMNSRGSILWQKVVDGEIRGAPSIGPDGTVYVGAGGSIVAVDGESGAVKWRASAGDTVGTTPVIGPDGSVYAGADNGRFVAVSATGAPRWTYQTGAPITASAAVSSDGIVYVGSGDATLYAFSPHGERLSTFRALDAFAGPIAIGPNGVVYAGARDNRLYALRDDVRAATAAPGDRLFGDVVRDPSDGRVFVIVDGQRRYIPDATTQGLLGLTTPVPRNLNSAELARYPEGPAIPALAEGMAIRASNGPLYVIRNGKRSWLRTAQEAVASGASLDQVPTLDDRLMRSLTLDLVDGMLVKASSERLYLFSGGQWHWLSSGAALAARGDWSQVHLIADSAFAAIPEGDPIG